MEILAIGSLAYLGSMLNNNIMGNNDTNSTTKKDDKKEKFAFFNRRNYQQSDLNKIQKNYNQRAKEIKELSFISDKSRITPNFYNQLDYKGDIQKKNKDKKYIIKNAYNQETNKYYKSPKDVGKIDMKSVTSFYNQKPSVGDQYKDEKLKIPGRLQNGKVSDDLNILDSQFEFQDTTLKTKDSDFASNYDVDIVQNFSSFKEEGDMTYGIFKSNELQHNNMQPFHRRRDEAVDMIGGKMTDEINSNNNMTKMELFTGSSKNYWPKEAPPAFFEPMKDVHFVNGMPAMTDTLIERFIPGNQRKGEKPFQSIKVQPGLGLDYNEDSKIGFHDTYRSPEPTIDYQRVGNRIQKTNPGVIIPGMKGQKQPVDPNVAKRRPEKVWEIDEYIHAGGNGGVSKPAVNPEQIAKEQLRAFSMELKNGISAANGSMVGATNRDGTVREPHKLTLNGLQTVGPSLQSVNNNNLPSFNILDNQRTETGYNYYDAPAGGDVRQVHQFNTQPTNSNMRQTTAETAQDGMAFGNVKQVHQLNTQPTNSNMRQTTAETAQDGMAYGSVKQVHQYNIQPTNSNLRQTTAETAQDGMAYGSVKQVHQYNIQPTNSNLRQTTAETAQDGMAYGSVKQVHQFNIQPTNSNLRQTTAETAQDGMAYGSVKQVHQYNTQPTNSNLRQTTAETAQDGMAYGSIKQVHQFNTQPTNSNLRQLTGQKTKSGPAYGDVRQVHQFNTQPTNSNLRQTTAETAQDGPAYGDARKVHQFNTQPTNSNLRQTTAETAQDGPAYGDARKVHQFNTQPTNSNLRQTTAETAQDGAAFGGVKKVHQFNTQPANSNLRQYTAETAQENPAFANVAKVHQYNKQPANSTIRQVVNYNDYSGPTHVVTENLRSRSDANAMTVHSAREDTTVGRLMTYSGWNEGISERTHGTQNSKERDINNNWTRVNPPSVGSRSNSLQDMKGFNLDESTIFQLNKLKTYPSLGDRIENSIAEVLQNNELINNAYQKYNGK